MKRIFIKTLILFITIFSSISVNATESKSLRTLFINNDAIIYEINIRTFNAKDLNNNGIIEIEKGETRGNFLNAIDRLDEISSYGVNTLHVMPVNFVGKTNAIGTAGSLYAMSKIDRLDLNITEPLSKLTSEQQFKLFVKEAHKRGLKIMVDIPACGAADMEKISPDLLKKDENNNFIIPSNWSDVRILKTRTKNGKINKELLDIHKKYIDLLLRCDVDGIRADVATMKPKEFWKELIDYTRGQNPDFMFLAEASENWGSVSPYAEFTNFKKLLAAGFDGYYGSCFDFFALKNVKEFENLFKYVNPPNKIINKKSIIGAFATHDTKSPYLISNDYAELIMYMNATLPLNPYFVDGFPTGDTYIYPYSGKKADVTYTDNDIYYTHYGQIDIFNFSRKPGGKDKNMEIIFKKTIELRKILGKIVSKGSFKILESTNNDIIAYERKYNRDGIIVIINKNQKNTESATIKNIKTKNFKTNRFLVKNGEIKILNNEIKITLPELKATIIKYQLY